MKKDEKTLWWYCAGVTALLLLAMFLTSCCSAQTEAERDTAWDGVCFQRSIHVECLKQDGQALVCYRGAPTMTREQVLLRVRLADERLLRLGMTCQGWQG